MNDLRDNQSVDLDPEQALQSGSSPGAKLAAGREQQGWTVEQVASCLKLAPRQIHALERDDFAALPGTPSVRGFIRSYAKLLRIDAAPLLAHVGGEVVLASESLAPREGLSTPYSEARLPSMSERPVISSKWVVGVLVLVLMAVTFWATRPDSDLMDLIQLRQAEPDQLTIVEPAPEAEVNTLESDAAPIDARSEANGPDSSQATPQTAPPEVAVVPTAVRAAPMAAPVAAMKTQGEPGANTLNLKLREESWIEVRRSGGGNALVARLMQAGESATVEVTEPMIVVIGNAAGVDATLRGAPVTLKGSTTTNVARLTLK